MWGVLGRQNSLALMGCASVICFFAIICISTDASGYEASSLRGNSEVERYMEVSWPANKNRGAVTFLIPEEYIHVSTTWRNKGGAVKSFAIQFELPGPVPVQSHSGLKGKKGTLEYEKFMKSWQGRFSMDIEPALVGGEGFRRSMRRQASQSDTMQADTDVSGLDRYSTLECFSEKDLSKREVKEFISGKDSDDGSPANCRLDRRWVVLVSPKEINKDDEGVGIRCSSTGCKAYFSVEGCGVSMGISHKDIENWPVIIEPARALVKGFIKTSTQSHRGIYVMNLKQIAFRRKGSLVNDTESESCKYN